MHEMSIASSILEAVASEAARCPGSRPEKVGVRIGELAAVDPESLRFCFEALIRDTDLQQLELEIEFKPRRHGCSGCGEEFNVIDYNIECPHCGCLNTRCISGDELELVYVEVEQNESSALGAQSLK
ncbi:MAG TPA: hydrogenase maturation nickel metallochaperone HypA [Terriglobales bacterium]|nr:hydrogenase maturation nickel metallochaperone HypA [Terriglobales bacterium]